LRRLDEWHKYVDIQAKRVSSAKSGQSGPPSSDRPDRKTEHSQNAQDGGLSEPLDDLYADSAFTADSFLTEAPAAPSALIDDLLPEHFRPTPLPSMIEFASNDFSHEPLPEDQELSKVRIEQASLAPPAEQAMENPVPPLGQALSQVDGGLFAGETPLQSKEITQNGRPSSSPARKETREELLARLLDPELTLDEAAQVLNVCPTTVRRYTNRGVLPHYRTIGNQRRFRLSQVLAFLESQEAASRSQSLGNGHNSVSHSERPPSTG